MSSAHQCSACQPAHPAAPVLCTDLREVDGAVDVAQIHLAPRCFVLAFPDTLTVTGGISTCLNPPPLILVRYGKDYPFCAPEMYTLPLQGLSALSAASCSAAGGHASQLDEEGDLVLGMPCSATAHAAAAPSDPFDNSLHGLKAVLLGHLGWAALGPPDAHAHTRGGRDCGRADQRAVPPPWDRVHAPYLTDWNCTRTVLGLVQAVLGLQPQGSG